MRLRRTSVAAVSVCAVVLTGCGGTDSDDSASGDQPYRVLVTGGISAQGELAANAQTAILAAQAGVKVQNEAGGIGGRQIELVVVDDAGDPTKAVTELRKAINSNKPDLYLNAGPSSVSSAVLPIANQNDILSFNTAPTQDSADPAKFPLNFDLVPVAADTAHGIANHARKNGYKNIGVLHGSSAYGEQFGRDMTAALAEFDLNQAGNEEYEVSALDMTAQLQSLKNAGADSIALDAYGAPLGYILQSLRRLGWHVPLIGNASVSATRLISNEPPNGVLGTPEVEDLVSQVLVSTVYDPNNTVVNTMVSAMSSLGSIPSTLMLANNYDAFALVAAAADSAGTTTDSEKLAAELETDDVLDGAATAYLSRYHFTAEDHGPNPGEGEMQFIAPTKVLNGQFGNPAAA